MIPVVVVSGWAMSVEVMAPLTDALQAHGCLVTTMSLADAQEQSWEALLAILAQKVGSQRPVLVGWSLGGNLCMRFAARYPERVAGVVTLGSTPCFVSAHTPFVSEQEWQGGKTEQEFHEISSAVVENMAAALKGFIPVFASGSRDTKDTIRLLRKTVSWTLEQGDIWSKLLDLLAEDARGEWKKVVCPVTHLLASNDPLAKAVIAQELESLLPGQNVRIVAGSHAIFADHPHIVVEYVLNMRERA